MYEAEILLQVSQIVSAAGRFADALARIRLLLEQTLGAQAVSVELPESASTEGPVTQYVDAFLEPSGLPYRCLYTVALRAEGRELGRLVACYASQDFSGGAAQRVSQYVGEQLGMLLVRTRLGQDCGRLQKELAALAEDLATRKILHRAEGILTARRGMTPVAAKAWISREAQQSKLPVRRVAERIVAGDTAERQLGFARRRRRIA